MTDEGGATRVVPGSKGLRRHPTPEELEDLEHIPIETPKGSVAVWDGAVWHSGGIQDYTGYSNGSACNLPEALCSADR